MRARAWRRTRLTCVRAADETARADTPEPRAKANARPSPSDFSRRTPGRIRCAKRRRERRIRTKSFGLWFCSITKRRANESVDCVSRFLRWGGGKEENRFVLNTRKRYRISDVVDFQLERDIFQSLFPLVSDAWTRSPSVYRESKCFYCPTLITSIDFCAFSM